jgi:hypothetical protein
MSRAELIELARRQGEVIARQDTQIITLSTQLAELMDRFADVSAKLARVEHLLSRNSDNSNFPSSKDGGIGGTPPSRKERRAAGRAKGKQKGAPGSALRLVEKADAYEERFPRGLCACGSDLTRAEDLGIVDRYQQHEIPLVSVKVTEYGLHAVACACGKFHTAPRPEGAGAGQAEYGPQLKAFGRHAPAGRVDKTVTGLLDQAPIRSQTPVRPRAWRRPAGRQIPNRTVKTSVRRRVRPTRSVTTSHPHCQACPRTPRTDAPRSAC